MPWWVIDWEVFAWIGHRRFARHWSVAQIRAELGDSYQIDLSDDAIENSIQRYQTMLAAREQDPKILAEEYRDVDDLVLCIDGLQPEKGHETLYVVRELRRKRVWFAESLISSSAAEVGRLMVQARQWAQRLGLPVRLWISDKQEAFVKGLRESLPISNCDPMPRRSRRPVSETLSTAASSCEKPAPRKHSPSYCKTSNSDTMTHHSLLADH